MATVGREKATTSPPDERPVRVWDLPTRVFHWLLATLILAAYLTQDTGQLDRHMTVGYVVLTLVLFRILWGFVGSETSRFARFIPTPGSVGRYLGGLARGRPPKSVGHNPLGSLLVYAMLTLVAFQAATGLFSNDDIFTEGPLAKLVSDGTSDLLTDLHAQSFWILVGFIAVHVVANFAYELVYKQPLIQAMVTGSKPLPSSLPAPRLRPWWVALPVLAVAAVTVWYVVTRL